MIRSSCYFTILLLCIALPAYTIAAPIKHVIYITVDGVRWQDVFLDHNHFPIFWKKYANKAEIYGAPDSNRMMEVASIPVSLPSYQSQMSGRVQPGSCHRNECGRIKMETFPEALITKKGLQKKEVATFASWELIDHALESTPGITYSNNGIHPAYDPISLEPDRTMAIVNKQQIDDYVRPDCRLDLHTLELAMNYYQKYQPTFMWLSFGNADDYAHVGNKAAYDASLRFYDKAIDQMISLLQELNIADSTMIVITTDHGRGDGEHWTDHNIDLPESKRTWAFVINGKLKTDKIQGQQEFYSTLSIRPTIEGVLMPTL